MALAALLLLLGCADTDDAGIDYRQEMRDFVQALSFWARGITPGFLIIPQNGAQLVSVDDKDAVTPDLSYINAIDGMGQESLFYGYADDDQPTPPSVRQETIPFLDLARDSGAVTILVTDYCYTPTRMSDSYQQNGNLGYISFAADHRELDNIPFYPTAPWNENADDITELTDARNFLYLINSQQYESAPALVDALAATNYDLLIIDAFFQDQMYTAAQVAQLQQKMDGGSRLVAAYLSIGEAEDYRYYWQPAWGTSPPDWLADENPDWPGNYKVRYWREEWQAIIFGHDDSYLQRILDAGFDGAYLDIIDAFEYFE